jgi:HK97 family phage portal protein
VGIVSRLLARGERRNLSLTDPSGWRSAFSLAVSTSGREITPMSAMQSVAVFACVRVLAESIGTLPLITYKRLDPRGKERAQQHPLYRVLHDRPNPEMTSVELRECIVGHLALRGNAYLEIVRDGNAMVRELWPLRPDMMRVVRERDDLAYYYTRNGVERPVDPSTICHIRGISGDGVHGYSPIALARDAVGLTLATEEYGARWFSGGARPGGVLQTQGTLSQEAADRLRDSWNSAHQGLDASHRVAVLEEGVTWQQIGIAPEDSQFLETRRFQTTEIARLFRVPPHMVQDLERATFTNIEHQSLDFVVHTLRPWLVRIEQAFLRDLFNGPLDRDYYAEFLVDGLLRGDLDSRYRAYATGRNWGWLSANDIREIENMNPLPENGDIYLQPLNMVEAGATTEEQDEQEQDVGTQNQPRALARSESRASGSAESRRRLAGQFKRLFVEMAGRLARREAAEVKQAAELHLNRRDLVSFRNWLREYYEAWPGVAARTALPTIIAYAEAVLTDAAAEIDSDDPMLSDLSEFLNLYAEKFGGHWAQKSLGQVEAVLRDAEAEDADQLTAVTTRLDEWTEKRPDKVGALEVVMLAGALSAARWRRGGVTKIRWVASGRNCAFCSRLNGKIIGIEQVFANEGDEIEGAPDQPKLKVRRKTKHPPIHRSCDCGLRPERG